MRALRISAALLALAAGGLHAQAPEPMSLQVSQAHVRLPEVTAYVYVLDQAGKPVGTPTAQGLSATVGQHRAAVTEVVPFEKADEGIAYVFLVDISRSLNAARFQSIKDELSAWIGGLGPRDRAAILAFGEQVNTVQDFTGDKQRLTDAIAGLGPTDSRTELYGAISAATTLARRVDPGLPKRRVAVLLSDGENDSASGLTRDELLDQMRTDRLPLYTIGYLVPPRNARKEAALRSLAELARRSGGAFVEAESLEQAYGTLREQIRNASVVRLRCEACVGDGDLHRLQMTLLSGTRALSDGLDVRLLPPPETPSLWERLPAWVYALAALSLVLLIAGIVLLLRREPEEEEPEEEPEEEVASWGAVPEPARSPVVSLPPSVNLPSGPAWTEPPVSVPSAPAAPGIRLHLAVIASPGAAQSRDLELRGASVIGRSTAEADLAFPQDPTMSGRHCELLVEDGAVVVRDLESRNGTMVNGVRIRPSHRLEDGDVIIAGQTQLRVLFKSHAGRAPRGDESTRFA